MNKYLTIKLGEECSEVAQAACKVLLHQDKPSREALLSEMADVHAMVGIAISQMGRREHNRFMDMVNARLDREAKKGKA